MYVTQTEYADIKTDFGAVGDGVADDTAAWQAAADSGKAIGMPRGDYLVSDTITLKTPGQLIEGEEKTRSRIVASSDFKGEQIVKFASGEEGPQLARFGITAATPAVVPFAIMARDTPRFRITDMRINLCQNGIDARGNTGGSNIDGLESWNTVNDILYDGALDVVTLEGIRVWPFGDPGDGNGGIKYVNHTAFQIGRVDGLEISKCMFFCTNQIAFFKGADGNVPWATVSNCEFDNWNNIIQYDGMITVDNCLFSGGPECVNNVTMLGGQLALNNNSFQNACSVMVAQTSGRLVATGNLFEGAGNPHRFVSIGGGDAIVSNNRFNRASGVNTTNGMLHVSSGGRLTAVGNRCPIDGTGLFVNVDRDEWHYIAGNRGGGWHHQFPANPTSGIYRDN